MAINGKVFPLKCRSIFHILEKNYTIEKVSSEQKKSHAKSQRREEKKENKKVRRAGGKDRRAEGKKYSFEC